MSATAAELDGYWRGLPPPAGPLLEAREVGRWAVGRLLAAVDADGHRHLLVAVPDHPRVSIARLRGMASQYRQLRAAGQDGIWLDLQLLDDRGAAAFTLLCSDVMTETAANVAGDPAVIAAVVRRWQRFWSSLPEGMDRESRLGLFGELWLLTRWLPDITAAAVTSWQGPLGGRHDFANDEVSVEVKVGGTVTGPLVHRISGLTQLAAPDQGRLYLLSLRVVAEATGIHSLDGLVAEARLSAADVGGTVADDLDERLAGYGWSPVHSDRYAEPLKVSEQHLYRVDGTFPRLTPGTMPGLPAGIVDIRYSLDTTVCAPWEIASEPVRPGPLNPLAR